MIVNEIPNNEIAEYLGYTSDDFHPYLPNEIFDDLSSCEDLKHPSHACYAYAYYYLCSYLYFNCKYGKVSGLDKLSQMNLISNIMKTNSRQHYNYISKKGGVLDSLGYTQTTTDYPVFTHIEDKVIVGFTKRSDYKIEFGHTLPNHKPNFKCKIPIKCLHDSKDWSVFDGRQFTRTNTHFIHSAAFMKIMNHDDLGFNGFYIYGFLRYMTDKFSKGYHASNDKLKEHFGFSDKRTRKILHTLRDEGLINISRRINLPNNHYAPKNPYFLKGNS